MKKLVTGSLGLVACSLSSGGNSIDADKDMRVGIAFEVAGWL